GFGEGGSPRFFPLKHADEMKPLLALDAVAQAADFKRREGRVQVVALERADGRFLKASFTGGEAVRLRLRDRGKDWPADARVGRNLAPDFIPHFGERPPSGVPIAAGAVEADH